MADYIPVADTDYSNWLTHFTDGLTTQAKDVGLSATEIQELLDLKAQWEEAYRQHLDAQIAASSAKQHKDDCRRESQSVARSLVKQIQAHPSTTNAQRAALGITLPDSYSTTGKTPTSRPVVILENRGGLRHTVNFVDENTPTRTAKPTGIMGAEVWVHVGDTAPADPKDMTFLGLDTRTPYEAKFEPAEAGKTAFYRLRWVNRKGEPGDWSAIASAVITP